MADQQILVTGSASAPLTYTVPNAIEAALLCVNATVDGTAAPSGFLATVEIVSDGGVVVARCPCFTTIASGGTAEVSWFRMRNDQTTSTAPVTAYETVIFSTPGLQLYWKLDEAAGTGTIADSAGGNNGTVYGLVNQGTAPLADVLSATYVTGMTGRKTATPIDQTTQLLTVLFWIKTTTAAGTTFPVWADMNAPGARWFDVGLTAAGHIFVDVFSTGAAGVTFGGVVAVNDGNKHCVAFTYDATVPSTGAGAVGTIYVDGALDTATALAMGGNGLQNANNGLVLGAKWRNAFDDPAGINQFPGTLDEFAVFNTPLTLAELAAINTAGRV